MWSEEGVNAAGGGGGGKGKAGEKELCELCGGTYAHPVTYHMRMAHPGKSVTTAANFFCLTVITLTYSELSFFSIRLSFSFTRHYINYRISTFSYAP